MRRTETRGENSLHIYWRDGSVTDSVGSSQVIAGLGFFDGVHLGHQAILRRVRDLAATIDGVPMAVTFDRHPLSVIRAESVPPLLTSRAERRHYMWDLGIEAIVELCFNRDLAAMEPEEFAGGILARRLLVVAVVAGDDFSFGYQGRGGIDLLRKKGPNWGITVIETVDSVLAGTEKVSSTRIRELLQAGIVEEAAVLLGRPYKLAGLVVEGEGRGRKLGFPTANLAIAPDRLIPQNGVYAVTVRQLIEDDKIGYTAEQGEYLGVLSISNKPTFASSSQTVEVHVLDQDTSYYGKQLEVSFHRRLRSIERFANAEELKRQVLLDIENTRKLSFGHYPSQREKIYSAKAL
jgi:riboflavin kinase/FMN adenylyltransferase